MISARPPESRSRVAKSWYTRTGSSEDRTVTALDRRTREVRSASAARTTAGADTAKSARWCSPTATTSSPTRSASSACSTSSRSRRRAPTAPAAGSVSTKVAIPSSMGAKCTAVRLLRVIVEAAPALASEEARLDHPVQQRRRDGGGIAELVVERLGHREQRVEPDQVAQRERSHRVRAALDHPLVDVLLGGEAGLVHPDRGEQVRDQQRVDDEPGAVLRVDADLAQRVLGEGARL